jgi:phosphoenolpyruvate carboxykinase (ATP)
MIAAALNGALDSVPFEQDGVFGLDIPSQCPGVPSEVLNPRKAWARPAEYDAQAARLATMFVENFETFKDDVSPDVSAAGPRLART